MTLLPLAAHILFFILNCGGNLDLTHGDLGVIDIERSKYSFAKPKVVKIVYYHIYRHPDIILSYLTFFSKVLSWLI